VLERLRAGRKPPTGPPPDRGVAAEAPRFGPTPAFGTPPGGTPTYGPAPVYGPRSRSDDGPGREPPPYGRRP
jgi:hypothetical protein